MAPPLPTARIQPYRASARAVSNLNWLTSHRSFNFPDYYSPTYEHFGPIRILNEDVVAPQTGFPMHAHRDAEIFSYILSGELTHRDSTVKRQKQQKKEDRSALGNGAGDAEQQDGKLFYRMKRGDVQFTTAGSGVKHSEENEGLVESVRFLQIWVMPWKKGLAPAYHTQSFGEEEKRKGFVTIISPLKGGLNATPEQEKQPEAMIPETIPIHADFVFGAGIIPAGEEFVWKVGGGGGVVTSREDRQVYVYLPTMKEGKAKIRLNGSDEAILAEGDGAFVRGTNDGDELGFESIGEAEAEVIVLDANHN